MTTVVRAVDRPLRAGLAAGALAGIIGALVQLPMHSPADSVFNSATVVAGALAAGAAAGYWWGLLKVLARRRWVYAAGVFVAFDVVALAAAVGNTQLERTIAYVVPLVAIVFAVTGVLTTLLARSSLLRHTWLLVVTVIIAVAVGAALFGMGDQQSGRLELPARGS